MVANMKVSDQNSRSPQANSNRPVAPADKPGVALPPVTPRKSMAVDAAGDALNMRNPGQALTTQRTQTGRPSQFAAPTSPRGVLSPKGGSPSKSSGSPRRARLDGQRSWMLEDRCKVCTIEDAWTAYGVFQKFALAGMVSDNPHDMSPGSRAATAVHQITRHGYFHGVSFEPTLGQLKVLRRAQLANRFRSSAAPVTIEEFFLRVWPKANAEDLKKLDQWCRMRNASDIIHHHEFRGTVEELREVFRFLDKDGDGTLSPFEIARARILDPEEADAIFLTADSDGDGLIDFGEFCQMLQPTLRAKYVNNDVKKRMVQEEQKIVDKAALDGIAAMYATSREVIRGTPRY